MILERLEALPVGSFHYKLLLVTGLGWLFDSMDTGLIAFVLPVLTKDWGLTPAQAGWIGSIGLIGMALGAVLAGTSPTASAARRSSRSQYCSTASRQDSVLFLGAMSRCSSSASSSASDSAVSCRSLRRS